MFDYDDGVLFAVIAACPYTEDLPLATGGPLDPQVDAPEPPMLPRFLPFVQLPSFKTPPIFGRI